MSNDTLTHAVDAPSNINNNLATQIGGTQATTVTTEDAALVSWSRTPMASASTGTVAASLSTTWISVWEFTNLITNKPNPSDPTTWDWSPAIAGAQAKAQSMAKVAYGGYGVSFTAGVYPVTRIIHYSGTPLQGMGSRNTFISALPFDPANGKPYGMLELAPGVVQGAHISGITFCGSPSYVYGTAAVNPNQWGFYCHAQYDASYVEGGFWHSNLVDVCFWNFKKAFGLVAVIPKPTRSDHTSGSTFLMFKLRFRMAVSLGCLLGNMARSQCEAGKVKALVPPS